jgi:cysteine desulfurase / selenocysteine lyase
MLCGEKGADLKVLPITDEGELRMDLLDGLLTDRTRIVAVAHVSNSLGTINPIRSIVEKAHARGIPVLVDGAQAVAHMPVDVRELGADFYAMSGHKLFGPTGIGVLWGRLPLLEAMPPYQGGGDMISAVTFKKTTYNVVPNKFEAGTPNIAGSVGLGAAIDYVKSLDLTALQAHEAELLAYGTDALSSVPGVRIVGTAAHKASVLSFVMEDVHPHDIGTILDQQGVAIRTGHHCTQPLMERLCVPATARASLALYNTKEEIDALVDALGKVREIFA